jgi:hypothetical protein
VPAIVIDTKQVADIGDDTQSRRQLSGLGQNTWPRAGLGQHSLDPLGALLLTACTLRTLPVAFLEQIAIQVAGRRPNLDITKPGRQLPRVHDKIVGTAAENPAPRAS